MRRHAQGGQHRKGLVQWTVTINMDYEIAAGYPPETAEKAFAALVKQRIDDARQQAGNKATIIPMSFSAEEAGIYSDPRASFALTFLVSGCNLKDIIKQSGMWTPTGQGWDEWKRSMDDSALNPYGFSQLKSPRATIRSLTRAGTTRRRRGAARRTARNSERFSLDTRTRPVRGCTT
jgi:hypothetical protein